MSKIAINHAYISYFQLDYYYVDFFDFFKKHNMTFIKETSWDNVYTVKHLYFYNINEVFLIEKFYIDNESGLYKKYFVFYNKDNNKELLTIFS